MVYFFLIGNLRGRESHPTHQRMENHNFLRILLPSPIHHPYWEVGHIDRIDGQQDDDKF